MTEFYVQPETQFAEDFRRLHSPISATFQADGDVDSTGISFEDYARMQTKEKKNHIGARRMAPPPYAVSDIALRKVLVAYLEARAFSKEQRKLLHEVAPCSEIQAINRAEQVLHSTKARALEATMDRLTHEYVALKKEPVTPDGAKRLKLLAVQIRNADTTLRINRNIAALVAGILYYYYRVGMDSVGVSSELGITPIHVRQMLKRVADCWEELTGTKIPRAERRCRVPRQCECGCGRMTKRRFLPGHNMRIDLERCMTDERFRERLACGWELLEEEGTRASVTADALTLNVEANP